VVVARLGRRPCQRPVAATLGARGAVHQVGGDADQPGPHLHVLGPVVGAAAEGHEERLAEQVVGELAHPAAQVAVHGGRVPVEEDREPLRVGQRRRDQLLVGGLRPSGDGVRRRAGRPVQRESGHEQ
jgi:hypothetical protein